MDLSIIIPAYNRVDMLRHTLESIRRATQHLKIEIILVDDGSHIPLSGQLNDYADLPVKHLRQTNSGALVARNNGLKQAQGEYVLFLDSDDIVHEDKLVRQVAALNESRADVCYTDMATAELKADYDRIEIRPGQTLTRATTAEELYLKVQPASHNSIYRRAYLQKCLAEPVVPADRRYEHANDVWLLYNLAIHPASIVKIDGHYTIYCSHEETRYSNSWERTGAAALAIMETFMRNCPKTPATLAARIQVGECAFQSWRALPRGFNAEYERRTLEVWRASPKGDVESLGGKKFALLAKLLGMENAGRLFKLVKNARYKDTGSLTHKELQSLMR